MRGRGIKCFSDLVLERHERNNSPVVTITERNVGAQQLFAPLAATYDRYANLLSFGQDPRWRDFLASCIEADPDDEVLDVATGTGAVAVELAVRYNCRVVGVDQSPQMLTVGRRRVAEAGESARVTLVEARAEELPFPTASFDHLTFTYLLRYVDDPGTTLRELARVVKPGGRIASLEFYLPERTPIRVLWELYVRLGLPVVGKAISDGWFEVGQFLGSSIRSFYAANPLDQVADLWEGAGVRDVRWKTMSLGGGVVMWGRRGD